MSKQISDKEDKGPYLQYDDLGFIVGMKRMERSVDKININVDAVRKLLEQSFLEFQQAIAVQPPVKAFPQPKLSAYQQFLQQANRQTVEYEDLVEEHAKAIQEATRKIQQATDQLNDTPPAARQEQDSDSKNKRAANGKPSTPARRITPNSGVVDIGSIDDLRRNFSRPRDENGRFTGSGTPEAGESNSGNQGRDANGRFTGNGTAGESKSVLSKFAKGFAVAAKSLIPDTKGVDPTVDAINELGTVLSPVRKVASFALRPLSGLFKSRKRNEPIPREQEQHNRRQLKILQRIADHANSGGSLAPLARLLPMAMAAIAGIGGAIAAGFAAAAPVIAAALATAVTAYLSSKAGNAINDELGKTETGRKVQGTLGKLYARTKALFGDKEAQEAVAASDKAADAERYKDRPENPFWGSNDGVYRAMRILGLEDWMKESAPGQAAGNGEGNTQVSKNQIKKVLEVGSGYNIVELADGSVVRQEGNFNWRNNNPGNIESGKFAESLGAIKPVKSINRKDSRFAVFPTYQAGRIAKEKLIFESERAAKLGTKGDYGSGLGYKAKTLTQAIAAYAPIEENNTAAYQKAVLTAVGNKNKRMSEYSADERKAIMDAMERVEGYKVGKTQIIKPASKNIQKAITPKSPDKLAKFANEAEVPKTATTTSGLSRSAVTPATAKLADQSALQSVLNQQPAVAAVAKRSSTNANMVTAQSAPIKIESIKERLTSPDPKEVVVVNQSNDTISQNVSNRNLAHAFTGGLGMGKWDA